MRFCYGICILLTFLVIVSANISDRKSPEDELAIVPDENGLPILVNVTEAVAEPEPFLFDNVKRDVQFELYTMENQMNPDILVLDDPNSIKNSHFKSLLPTRVFIHGWNDKTSIKELSKAYFEKGHHKVNLISVNWIKLSSPTNYALTATRVQPIGSHVAKFIDFLVKNDLVLLDNVNVIGFSLGAHMAGIAGKTIQSGKLRKIVGLDPSGPLFSVYLPGTRIDRTDADYVEVVHTSNWGFHFPIGTSNFYPNGGRIQLDCKFEDVANVCSHHRALQYFAKSISAPDSVYAYPCKSLAYMKLGICFGTKTNMLGEPGNYEANSKI